MWNRLPLTRSLRTEVRTHLASGRPEEDAPVRLWVYWLAAPAVGGGGDVHVRVGCRGVRTLDESVFLPSCAAM